MAWQTPEEPQQKQANERRGPEWHFRVGVVLNIIIDALVVLLLARAFFVMARTISHPVGDAIIRITDPLVRPFGAVLESYIVNEFIIIVWDVLFALAVYSVVLTIIELFVQNIGRRQ